MAQHSTHKRRPKRQVSFHEALPLPLPAATLPHVADHFGETANAWVENWRGAITQLRHGDWSRLQRLLLRGAKATTILSRRVAVTALRSLSIILKSAARTGLATTNGLIYSGSQIKHALVFGGQVAWRYAPSIGLDLGSGMRATSRRVSSKPARRLYAVSIILAIIGGGAGVTAAGARTLDRYANSLSTPLALMSQKKTGTTILDKDGRVIYQGYGAQDRQYVAMDELPGVLQDATIAAEDPEFYNHPGFSWQGTARAALTDMLQGSKSQGGSTLTQQLVKNNLLTQDKNFIRKFNELLLSIKIEQRYSKHQILEMYLNSIYYGQSAIGVQAAAQTYFHKDAKDLSLGEAALIAGLPLGPNRFDPNYDVEAATGRRDFVISRMLGLGKITKAQADEAKAQPIALAGTPQEQATEGAAPMVAHAREIKFEAPHFIFYVLDQLRETYGEKMIEEGGITVHTTLDSQKQKLAEETVARRVAALSDHHVTNGGLISLEPQSGNILAMVGSIGYSTPGFGSVNVTLAQLQPGSSFKPFAYVTAFKKGWNGATTVDDVPLSIPMPNGSVYTPMNYDLQFHGKVTLRKALDNSFNIPAVKVLQFAGIHDTIATAHDLGITSLQDESRFGPALVLGGGEVRAIDMAVAYGTFANGGKRVPARAITRVEDRTGVDITKPGDSHPADVLDPKIAYMITHILSDDSSRQPEFPANGPLKLSRPAAAKTGTTNDFRDNWTVGYTPQIATAVWVGNNDHSAMENIDGITGAAPIWHDYMEGAHEGLPVESFSMPGGLTLASVCPDGSLADGFSAGTTEVFLSDALPSTRCQRRNEREPNKPNDANASPSPTPSADNPANGSETPIDTQPLTPAELIRRVRGGLQPVQ